MEHDGETVNDFGTTSSSLDFDYVLHHEHLQQHYNNIEHHPFPSQIISPPADFPPAVYQYDNAQYPLEPSWPQWNGESQMNLFEKQPPSALGIPPLAMPSLIIPRVEDHYIPPAYLQHQDKRPCYVNKVRETTAALQRVQGSRVSKRTRRGREASPSRPLPKTIGGRNVAESTLAGMSVVYIGRYECKWPGCNDKVFKRREHLKRHEDTVHKLKDLVYCCFCLHQFNRHDNSRSHCFQHATANKPGKARVEYHPLAPALYEKMMQDVKNRKGKKKGQEQPKVEEEPFIGPKLPEMMSITMLSDAQKIELKIPRELWDGKGIGGSVSSRP
ncbi:hypothetical protein O1611_g1129 [Lasiodiplodia mahajangana]|uniref:Uncharacterized protein n=1 Tax=Lasiodiplodia mahajangana TaxID=1108764 RepID=A0ACC2JYZ5_9PEZI|nr:hypothetical protein O1611_g1129 [Lasiodiplodia mahajangana]